MRTDAAPASYALRLVASLCVGVGWISPARRFGTVVDCYLIASAILDGIRIHSLWVASLNDRITTATALAALQTCVLVVTVAIVIVREILISRELSADRGDGTVQLYEEEAGTLSKICLAWVIPLAAAAKKVGVTEDSLKIISLHPDASYRLNERGEAPFTDREFFWRSVGTIATSTLFAAALSGLSLVQPLIVSSIVDYLDNDNPVSKGVWLVIAMFFA